MNTDTHTTSVNNTSTTPAAHDPYAEQAKKETTIGKIEISVGKALHISSLVAKGEAHIEHAELIAEKGTNVPGAHPSEAEVARERENLAEAPSLAGGVESFGTDGHVTSGTATPGAGAVGTGVAGEGLHGHEGAHGAHVPIAADPVVAGPGGQSGLAMPGAAPGRFGVI